MHTSNAVRFTASDVQFPFCCKPLCQVVTFEWSHLTTETRERVVCSHHKHVVSHCVCKCKIWHALDRISLDMFLWWSKSKLDCRGGTAPRNSNQCSYAHRQTCLLVVYACPTQLVDCPLRHDVNSFLSVYIVCVMFYWSIVHCTTRPVFSPLSRGYHFFIVIIFLIGILELSATPLL